MSAYVVDLIVERPVIEVILGVGGATGSGGAVTSVNGRDGVVVLDAADVGAASQDDLDTVVDYVDAVDTALDDHIADTVGPHGSTAVGDSLRTAVDQAAGRSALGLGSAAVQPASVTPTASTIPIAKAAVLGLGTWLAPGWFGRHSAGTPTASNDSAAGYEVGSPWFHTATGRTYRAVSVALGAAVWRYNVLDNDVTATPAADYVPRADSGGKLDAWISSATDTVWGLVKLGATGGAQAYSALLTSIASFTGAQTGMVVKTGTSSATTRSVTGSNGVAVTNGNGVSGDIAVAGVAATTSAAGVVELGTDGEATSDVVPTGADTRFRITSFTELIPTLLTGYLWTNMPAAETAYPGGRHVRVTLTLAGATRFRLSCRSNNAVSGAKLRVKYSTDGGSTFFDLASSAGAGDVALTVGATVANTTSAWATIASGALAGDILLDLYGVSGDGSFDPTIQFAAIEWGA